MKTNAKLAELKSVQKRADTLRKELGISAPGEVIFLALCDGAGDDMVVVEADGFGRATTSVVLGNYPVDYNIKFERSFPSEQDAVAAAEDVAFNGISPSRVLGVPR